MPAAIENCAFQRAEGLKEQSLDQDLHQVLVVAVVPYYVPHIHSLCFAMTSVNMRIENPDAMHCT